MTERNKWLIVRKYYYPSIEKREDMMEQEGCQILVEDFDEEDYSEQQLL
jgi:hypothetical protein